MVKGVVVVVSGLQQHTRGSHGSAMNLPNCEKCAFDNVNLRATKRVRVIIANQCRTAHAAAQSSNTAARGTHSSEPKRNSQQGQGSSDQR